MLQFTLLVFALVPVSTSASLFDREMGNKLSHASDVGPYDEDGNCFCFAGGPEPYARGICGTEKDNMKYKGCVYPILQGGNHLCGESFGPTCGLLSSCPDENVCFDTTELVTQSSCGRCCI